MDRISANPWVNERTYTLNQGLRAHMLRVYNYMTGGVLLTALMSFMFTALRWDQYLFVWRGNHFSYTGLGYLAVFAPLMFIFALSFGINRLGENAAKILFLLYAASVGISLSVLLEFYTGQSIARVFFVSSATFAAMSLYGYTTKKDLSGVGSFMMMGLFGLVIAGVVNLFLMSSALQSALSLIGVVVFVGLTAWDTQRIKSDYINFGDNGKRAVFDALQLYLNFLNIFLSLLRLMGDRR